MADTHKKVSQQVWSGYECPACFGVFRVPKGNEHREAVCPRCETILQLTEAPAIGVGTPLPNSNPTISTLAQASLVKPEVTPALSPERESVPREQSPGKGVKKRRKKVKSSLDPDWERTEHARKAKTDWKLPIYLVIGGVVFLALVMLGSHFLSPRKNSVLSDPPPVGESQLGLGDEAPSAVVEPAGRSSVDVDAEGDRIFAAVRRFLSAGSVDEMLTMIRGGSKRAEKVERYYAKHPYLVTVPRTIGEDGTVSMLGELVSVNVLMQDYSVRPIALEKVDDGFLVDWESWVGYSEMAWEEFLRLKPRRGKQFRVIVSPVDYYNFDFRDEGSWRSFQITSGDGQSSIYGYVPRSSPMVETLTPLDPALQTSAFVVKIRFPLEEGTGNQVLIESVVTSGWVVTEESN